MATLAFETPIETSGSLPVSAFLIGTGAAAVAPALALDLITTRAGFDALEPEWNALFERAGRGEQMFQQFNWLWHWANHYATAGTEFAIVTGRRAGKLALVWPTVIERPARLRQLAWMGDPVGQYGDVLIDQMPDQAACLAQSWKFLIATARPDLVRLTKVRADAAVAALLQAEGFTITASEEAPSLSMPAHGTYERFEVPLQCQAPEEPPPPAAPPRRARGA